MVASFMPSMAFAVHTCDYPVTVSAGKVEWKAVKEALKTDDAKYIEVVKEPTHTEDGIVKLTCKADYCNEVSGDLVATKDKADHVVVKRDLDFSEYADAMVAQKTGGDNFKNATAAANWVKNQRKTHCYMENVNVCSCGYVGVNGWTAVAHNDANKTYNCADYKCLRCDAVIEGVGHEANTATDDFYMGYLKKAKAVAADKVSEPNCGNGTGYKWECKHCGEKVAVVYTADPKTTAHNYGTAVDKSVATEEQASGKFEVKEGYVGVQGETTVNKGVKVDADDISAYKFYQLNHVKTEGTCTEDTVKDLKCETCGKVRPGTEQSITAKHDYNETKVAATCDHGSYTHKVCKVCGNEENSAEADDKKAHSYKATKVAATCTSAEYYVVECATCGETCAYSKGVKIDNAGTVTNVKTGTACGTADLKSEDKTAKTKTFIYTGFDGKLKGSDVIELTISTANAGAHKFGNNTLLKEATCTTNEVWGKKCINCGKLDALSASEKLNTKLGHDYAEVKTPATCGTFGAISKTCTRCNHTVDTVKDTTAKPVVALGTKCSFDKWVVTKKATVFEEGVKSLECSVCGADGAAKTVVAKAKYAAPAVKAGKKSATVTVKATSDAAKYQIKYKKAGGSYKTIAAKAGKNTIKKLAKGKKYTFKAIAVNAEGVEVASATKTVKVK